VVTPKPRLADLRALLKTIRTRLDELETRRRDIESSLTEWRKAEALILRYARRKGGVL